MNRIVITKINKNNKDLIAYLYYDSNRTVLDFQVFDSLKEPTINSIYIGKVENIIANINAAFVRISKDCVCYLPLEDVVSPIYTQKKARKKELCIGDELFVQVIKEAVKTKAPVITTKLTIHGKYCILTTHNTSVGISHKIRSEKKEKILTMFQTFTDTLNKLNCGVVARTIANDITLEELKTDFENALQKMYEIQMNKIYSECYSKVYDEVPGYIKKVLSIPAIEYDYIYTDCSKLYEELLYHKVSVKHYEDLCSLNALYGINDFIDTLLNRRIWMKSGANIIIEQLETLTIIDVNTAKNISKNGNVTLDVNCEAVTEICKQIRFRNISGIIIIDFINMDIESQQQLIEYLKNELKKDSVPFTYVDITKLGLIELTRKKTYQSLKDIIEI